MNFKELYFGIKGRIGRKTYILASLPLAAIHIAVSTYEQTQHPGVMYGPLTLGAILVLFWPGLALAIKRAHDRNRPAWFALLMLVPLVNLWPMIELVFLKGTQGENQYGPDPLKNTAPATGTA